MNNGNGNTTVSNSELLEIIEDNAARSFGQATPDRAKIVSTIKLHAQVQATIHSVEISEQDIDIITKKLESRFDIRMEVGNILAAEDYTPWLDDARENIDWYYWERYKRLLPDKKFSREVVNVLDMDTNEILGHLENPKKQGGWQRKGLCVGHVQSGKTANYLGVICKAADAGYKVIIVMAGLLNALRNQTQERIDEGFIGEDSSRMLDAIDKKEKRIGVGKFCDDLARRTPWSLTTRKKDFNKPFARQMRLPLKDLNEPVIFVIKKNVSTLKTLISWLKSSNFELNRFPMLLIDDEADHASVNTSKEDDDPTATNRRIRELLGLFEQSSYLGYTATPFANIFIDPETDDEMLKDDDLFPSDFIISLGTPSNYVGAKRIFEDDGDLKIVREIDDYEDILPLKHKIDEFPETLPPSLFEAIRVFVLVKAMRNLRGQAKSHNSMLVNVSRFTKIQSKIKWQIHEYIEELRQAINNHHALSLNDAMNNSLMSRLKETWEKEFFETEFIWEKIQKELSAAVSKIRVIEVNGASTDSLDYNRYDYPNGRNIIAVGGLSLSRGLTLEGLTVSYFLRNSIMYDTLMQMGRWFGYRTDFEDICRIYMSEEASSWYAHISRVTEELRDEFKRMEQARMTPRDFGLCVRSHPESLIVTARNKMRTGRSVVRQVSLEGRLVETSVLFKTPDVVSDNHRTLKRLVQGLINDKIPCRRDKHPGYLYTNVPVSMVTSFVHSFSNHPASQLTESKPIIDYADWLQSKGSSEWDVFIVSLSKASGGSLQVQLEDFTVVSQRRTVSEFPGNGIALNKRRVASRGHEKAGLSQQEINLAESEYRLNNPDRRNFPDSIYRGKRKKPLLMIHVLDCRDKTEPDKPLFTDGIVAYGISFPGEAGIRRPERLVEYVVNTVWWNSNYADLLDEEDDFE